MRYGKSYQQWLKEVERYIKRQGFSLAYANAQALCVRGLYCDKHHYTAPDTAAQYALRSVLETTPKVWRQHPEWSYCELLAPAHGICYT